MWADERRDEPVEHGLEANVPKVTRRDAETAPEVPGERLWAGVIQPVSHEATGRCLILEIPGGIDQSDHRKVIFKARQASAGKSALH